MDPLSIIGGVSATGAIVAAIVRTLKSLSDAYGKFGDADKTISLLIAELTSIKAAVVLIEDWSRYNRKKSVLDQELATAFEISFEGCKVAMDILATDIDGITEVASRNPFFARAKFTWNDVAMKDHADRLRSQVAALQLLVQAVHCHNATQQKILLEKPWNKNIIQQVADDTSTLCGSPRRNIGSYANLCGGSSTVSNEMLSTISSAFSAPDAASIRASTNPFRRSTLQLQTQSQAVTESQSPRIQVVPELKSAVSIEQEAAGIQVAPEMVGDGDMWRRRPTVSTRVTEDSGFYDADADLVNPVAYRKEVASGKARKDENVHRSISDPFSRTTPLADQDDEVRDQLSPMERFRADTHKPRAFDIDSFDSKGSEPSTTWRPVHHRHSFSDAAAHHTLSAKRSEEFKISLSGTIKRFTSLRGSASPGSHVGGSPGGTNLGRVGTKSVKRKGETNIHHSIDFGSKDGLSAPPIVRAAQSDSKVEIQRLIEQRVDIEARHQASGRTALAVASHCGNDGVVAMLLHQRARNDVRDANGMMPLHLAASRGHYMVVKLLLEDDAEVDAPGPNQRTPLRFASDNGHFHVCELLLEFRAKVNSRDSQMFTALHAAAKIGDVELVKLLIKYGADFEAKDAQLMTAMHYAAEADFEAVVLELLSRKADIESLGANGKTPLCCACESGARETALLLISKKANIKHTADEDMTPLHFACQGNKHETAEILLKQKRISVDARNSDGRTSLHLAVWKQGFAAVELLIRKGANLEAQCRRLLRPLHYAASNGDQMITQFLLGHGANIGNAGLLGYTPLHLATLNGSDAVVELLLRKGAYIEARNSHRERALCLACERGHLDVVKKLLDHGSKMQLRATKCPSLEDSPLCRAAKHGHKHVVQELIRRGSSVRQVDEQNWQPLRHAAYNGHAEVVDLLLRAGATVWTRDGSQHISSTDFDAGVDPGRRREVMRLLSDAARERGPNRVQDMDEFLTLQAPSADGSSVAVKLYEMG